MSDNIAVRVVSADIHQGEDIIRVETETPVCGNCGEGSDWSNYARIRKHQVPLKEVGRVLVCDE